MVMQPEYDRVSEVNATDKPKQRGPKPTTKIIPNFLKYNE